ncbi:restriction endonuclease subunit S [Idiomarina sp. OT37-5b]|uniref:restriction endonuclease subunit S n=1 Tax=Idiomarina sp. OT37-5b TaxID=2100422 RepID=UPI000CFA656E|nr:restriction endonuclease subunit S [Idiomarina sp. OT37-5b]AVJ55855.1 restriction endonuclease subunit S [Idiomarina sp. OT37-5b]
MSLKRYKSFKKAGEEWLPEIPSHWTVVPLWSLFARHKLTGFANEQLLSVYRDYGVIPKKSRKDNFNKASEDLSAYQLVDVNDLVINKMKAWQGSVAISKERGIVSPAYHVYAPLHNESPRYLHYLFRSKEYIVGYLANSKGIRVNQWDLEPQLHSRMKVLLPPKLEQQKIAQFLDYETTKIDALIDEQKRLIELLKEKRQAVISHAVTKGLNPDAPMKDSGVEWLGQIPEHWKITPIKHVTKTFEQGWSPQCFNEAVSNDSELGVLKVGCVKQGRFDYSENKRLPPELKFKSELAVRAGDLLISRANTRELVGSAGVPTVNHDNLMISDKLFRLKLTGQAISRFVCFFLTTKAARQQIELAATGASDSMLNIGQGTIREMPFPCPPVEEQRQIVDYVVRVNWQLLELAGEALKLVNTLKERRSALISAAVTGKIDVRDWQPPAGSDTVDSNASMQTERHYG